MSKIKRLINGIHKRADHDLKIAGPVEIGGEVYVQGSKNAALKLVAVTIALPGKYEIRNFPSVLDPLELLGIAEKLGAVVDISSDNIVHIDTTRIKNKPISYDLTITTTGAFSFAGALLGRFGRVRIGKPGGDKIGARPVDLHCEGLRALGAQINESSEELEGRLDFPPKNKHFKLRMPSTGAAVNFVLAVAASGGTASLENSPYDGDMENMYRLMRLAGVKIDVQESSVHIDATDTQPYGPIIFVCSPDRNDAFTWLAYGALSRKGLRIDGLSLRDIEQGLSVFRQLNVQISKEGESTVFVKAPPPGAIIPANTTVTAGLAREFLSDWAPLLAVVLTKMRGRCRVIDTAFSNRVRQAELLKKMSADVQISGGGPPQGVKLHFNSDPDKARYITDIHGPTILEPIAADIGYDVRACAAIVMAASQAEGTSTLSEVWALHRGYENVVERLQSVGVKIASV